MALDTYANLKIAVINQSHRGDLDLQIDDFILLTEAEIRANPDEPLNLRGNELIATGATVVDSDSVALPTRYQRSRSLRITIGTQKFRLTYRTPQDMVRRQNSGPPIYYTILGDNIVLDIEADRVYVVTFEYEADLNPLSATNTTNNVLTRYPNIYLYGCLKQAFIWAVDNEEVSKYNNLFLTAISSANTAEMIARYGESPNRAVRWAP
jgi:hypothetical protein